MFQPYCKTTLLNINNKSSENILILCFYLIVRQLIFEKKYLKPTYSFTLTVRLIKKILIRITMKMIHFFYRLPEMINNNEFRKK